MSQRAVEWVGFLVVFALLFPLLNISDPFGNLISFVVFVVLTLFKAILALTLWKLAQAFWVLLFG